MAHPLREFKDVHAVQRCHGGIGHAQRPWAQKLRDLGSFAEAPEEVRDLMGVDVVFRLRVLPVLCLKDEGVWVFVCDVGVDPLLHDLGCVGWDVDVDPPLAFLGERQPGMVPGREGEVTFSEGGTATQPNAGCEHEVEDGVISACLFFYLCRSFFDPGFVDLKLGLLDDGNNGLFAQGGCEHRALVLLRELHAKHGVDLANSVLVAVAEERLEG